VRVSNSLFREEVITRERHFNAVELALFTLALTTSAGLIAGCRRYRAPIAVTALPLCSVWAFLLEQRSRRAPTPNKPEPAAVPATPAGAPAPLPLTEDEKEEIEQLCTLDCYEYAADHAGSRDEASRYAVEVANRDEKRGEALRHLQSDDLLKLAKHYPEEDPLGEPNFFMCAIQVKDGRSSYAGADQMITEIDRWEIGRFYGRGVPHGLFNTFFANLDEIRKSDAYREKFPDLMPKLVDYWKRYGREHWTPPSR